MSKKLSEGEVIERVIDTQSCDVSFKNVGGAGFQIKSDEQVQREDEGVYKEVHDRIRDSQSCDVSFKSVGGAGFQIKSDEQVQREDEGVYKEVHDRIRDSQSYEVSFKSESQQNVEYSFYQYTSTSLEKALGSVLIKALAKDFRAVIYSKTQEFIDKLNVSLWTYATKAFIPHGSNKDEFKTEQKVYLTIEHENPNQANMLIIADNTIPEIFDDSFKKCLIFFSSNDITQLSTARELYKKLKSNGQIVLNYFKQEKDGSWNKQA